jgi:hypothetical protein
VFQVPGSVFLVPPFPVPGSALLTTGYWLLATGYRLPATGLPIDYLPQPGPVV